MTLVISTNKILFDLVYCIHLKIKLIIIITHQLVDIHGWIQASYIRIPQQTTLDVYPLANRMSSVYGVGTRPALHILVHSCHSGTFIHRHMLVLQAILFIIVLTNLLILFLIFNNGYNFCLI